jgi:hypothetical protein
MKKSFLILVLLIQFFPLQVLPQGIIFQDNFESYTAGFFPSENWVLCWSGTGTQNQLIVDDECVSPNQSLKLEGAPNWAGNAHIILPQTPPVIYCEGYIKVRDLNHNAEISFKNPGIGPWGTYYAAVSIGWQGKILCNSIEIDDCEANVWYHVKMMYNSHQDFCNVWINDELKGIEIPCPTNGEYTAFCLQTHNVNLLSQGWFDDVKVYGSKGWQCDGYDQAWSYHYPFKTETLIQNTPPGEDWSINTENPLIITGDINGDGLLEIIYTGNNMLHVLDGDGKELWSKEPGFIEPYLRAMLADYTGDGIPEIAVGTRVNNSLRILVYDGSGILLKEFIETEGVGGDNFISARTIADIDNDGSMELVAWRGSGYNLWSRGVEVFDFESGNPKWFYSIGPGIFMLNVEDITGNSEKEILTGTFGPNNGHSVNGFSDSRCYAICWDADGNLLWSRQFEGLGFVDSYVSVNDLDGDGKNEVIYTSREHGWDPWEGNLGRIYLLNPDDGEIIKEYNAGKPLVVNGIADITGDSDKEILVSYIDGSTHTGKVLMFDNALNLLDEYVVPGSLACVSAINDLNGDGNLEIIVRKILADAFVVLDQNLNELWSLNFPDEVVDVIPSDLNNDGINELVVTTQNSLQVKEWKFLPSFIVVLNDRVACKNDSIAFAVIAEGTLPIYYQWQKDGVDIQGASDSILIIPDIQPEDGGEYRCVATNDYGSDTTYAALLTIEFSIPTGIMGFADVLAYQVATYSVDSQEGHTYEFLLEGGNRIDGTENSITVHWGAAGQGFIKLLETSEIGCIADTNTLNVHIGNLGIREEEAKQFLVYPNPADDEVVVSVSSQQSAVGSQVKISIFDWIGREIRTYENEMTPTGECTVRLEVSDLPAGVYLVRLQAGGQSAVRKLIMQ